MELDMRVIVGCRVPGDGERLLKEFRAAGISRGSMECLALDLTDLSSVRAFATKILRKKTPIHLLINNAGIMAVPFEVTVDGLESHFQVNYLSHFLLINLLLPRLGETAEDSGEFGRIVNVSSSAQYDGKVEFGDLELRHRYNPFMAYFNSKWMQVVMTRYLDAGLQARGTKVRVNSLHPGVVATELVNHLPWHNQIIRWIAKQILLSPDQGADEVLFVALSSAAWTKGGEYFVQRQVCPIPNDTPRIQKKLWDISCQLTQIQNEFS